MSSKLSKEALLDGENLEEQKRMLKEFKDRHTSKTENQIDGNVKPVKDQQLNFDDQHFQESLNANAESPQRHSTGCSTFYFQNNSASVSCYEEALQGNN